MSELSSLVRRESERLVQRWIERVREGVAAGDETELELRDHIPVFLAELVRVLERGAVPVRSAAAEEHGRQRYRIGFDVEMLVREYGILRNVILDAVETSQVPLTLFEVRVLTDFLSNAVADGVREHGEQEKATALARAALDHEATRQREEHLVALLSSIGDGVIASDRHGRVTYLNPTAETLTGWSREEAMGRAVAEVFSVVDSRTREALRTPVARVLEKGSMASLVTGAKLLRRDGTEVPIDDSAAPVHSPAGAITGVILLFRDVSQELAAAEERQALLARERAALAQAEAERSKQHELFMQAPVPIAILEGPEHIFTFANPAYRALINGRDVVGKSLHEALSDVRGQGLDVLLDRVFTTGETVMGSEIPIRLDHHGELERLHLDFVYSPRRDANGVVDGVLMSGWDVSAQVEARRRAESLALVLKRQAEFEQQLIGIVSHDLRNPLNVVLMGSKLLSEEPSLDDQAARLVGRVRSAGERATRLIRDLLDFTQARLGGGIPLDSRPVDVQAVIRGIVEEVELAFPGRKVELRQSGEGEGLWDDGRVGQLVQNLLTNALRYSPADGAVEVVSELDQQGLRLCFHNGGTPIPPEKIALLFEPFQRAGAQVDKAGRSVGLGLYIVKEIVEAHQGSTEVQSSEAAGTTFTVKLPRKKQL